MPQAYEKSFRLAIFNRTDAGELDLGVSLDPACLHPVRKCWLLEGIAVRSCWPSSACRADNLEAGSPLEVCSYLVHLLPIALPVSCLVNARAESMQLLKHFEASICVEVWATTAGFAEGARVPAA